MQTLMLSVKRLMALFTLTGFCTVFEIENLYLFNVACEQYHTNEYSFEMVIKRSEKNVKSEQGLMVQSHLCFYLTDVIPCTTM